MLADPLSLDRMQSNGHVLDPPDEVVGQALDLANDFDPVEALHDLFPQHAQLHLRQPVTHAAMHAETE